MVLPDLNLFAVDPGTEGEVACYDRQHAGNDACDDGADVRTRTSTTRARASGDFCDGGAVGTGDGVGLWFSGGQGAGGGCLNGCGEGCAACFRTADDLLDGLGDGVAVGTFEACRGTKTALVGLLGEGVTDAVLLAVVGLFGFVAC